MELNIFFKHKIMLRDLEYVDENKLLLMQSTRADHKSQASLMKHLFGTNIRPVSKLLHWMIFFFFLPKRQTVREFVYRVKIRLFEKNAHWKYQWWEQSMDVKSHIHLTCMDAPTIPDYTVCSTMLMCDYHAKKKKTPNFPQGHLLQLYVHHTEARHNNCDL